MQTPRTAAVMSPRNSRSSSQRLHGVWRAALACCMCVLLPASAMGAMECRPDPVSCDRVRHEACSKSKGLAFLCPVRCGKRSNCSSFSSPHPDTPTSSSASTVVTSTVQATRMPNNTGTLNPWLHVPRLYENNARPLLTLATTEESTKHTHTRTLTAALRAYAFGCASATCTCIRLAYPACSNRWHAPCGPVIAFELCPVLATTDAATATTNNNQTTNSVLMVNGQQTQLQTCDGREDPAQLCGDLVEQGPVQVKRCGPPACALLLLCNVFASVRQARLTCCCVEGSPKKDTGLTCT